jgi:hypothetical protein
MQDGSDNGSLSATTAVALRWRIAGAGDPALVEAECAASVRALAACLEAGGALQEGQPPDRVEAKLDLLLATMDRLSQQLASVSAGARHEYLHCDACFGPGTIEWDDPLPPLPDGTRVVLEVRAVPGHPVTACLPATMDRVEGAVNQTVGCSRLRATLDPMPAATRDAYERCVFVLHRRAVRSRLGRLPAG